MNETDDELSPKQREFIDFLEKASNHDSLSKGDTINLDRKKEKQEVIHLNSLITKNISLFTNNPNYKLLAWLVVQLIILSLFILAATSLKNNLVPYINSL